MLSEKGKKRLAKEWLLFLGVGILPWFAVTISTFLLRREGRLELLGQAIGDEGLLAALVYWVFFLSPYLFVQLIRSIIWSTKTLWTKEPDSS